MENDNNLKSICWGVQSLRKSTAFCKTTEFLPVARPRSFPHHILVRQPPIMSKLIYDLAVTVEIVKIIKWLRRWLYVSHSQYWVCQASL